MDAEHIAFGLFYIRLGSHGASIIETKAKAKEHRAKYVLLTYSLKISHLSCCEKIVW